jgi:signal transduction histidine kinase
VRGVSDRPAGAALVRSRPSGWDVLLALAIFAFGLITASTYHGAAPALPYALATLVTLPLLFRCLFPVPVLAAVVAVTAVVGLSYTRGWWPFAAIVALDTVAAHCPRRISLRAGAAALIVLSAPIVYQVDWSPLGWNDFALVAERYAPLVAAWLLGANLRTRREYLRAVEERAAQLEREQKANALRAAAEEQARIAREVHDVVAHIPARTSLVVAGGDLSIAPSLADAGLPWVYVRLFRRLSHDQFAACSRELARVGQPYDPT